MSKYRKKPVVIEAEQFHIGAERWPDGILGRELHRNDHHPHVKTLRGSLPISDGDWIVTNARGEKSPCEPDVFEATYDLVEEAPDAQP
jgi:hypothetical protein